MSVDVHLAAARLLAAREKREPLEPLSAEYADLSIPDAYAIQLAQVDVWQERGRSIAGYKVGLTAKAIQRQLGVDQPDFGHLFRDDFLLSGEAIAAERFIQPRVEPEISFVLGRTLKGPSVTVADVLNAIEYAVASLEIIDSRIAGWRIALPDTIADNASAGGVVLGSTPVSVRGVDLRLIGTVLRRNGRIVHTGAGAAVLGSPVSALVWLVNTLGALGTSLEAGSVVMAGALTAAVDLRPGDTVTADFTGLGSVTTRLAATPEEYEEEGLR